MHVTADYVADRLEKCLPDGWTAHSLRHRFATAAYNATKDLRAVQQLLGHARPETTARYTLVGDDAMTAAVMAVA
jgi:site-specific recombinase XerD